MAAPSLEGRVFADVTADHAGDVGADTRFEYHEEADGVIWARYAGGTVRLGHLVGTQLAIFILVAFFKHASKVLGRFTTASSFRAAATGATG
ncbi:MAG: hypothetical protein AAF492_24690, partial [Verrucomicrobiota bacterium]